jgi:hypothetical protein
LLAIDRHLARAQKLEEVNPTNHLERKVTMATLESHIAAIQRYVDHGIEPGSGTRAVLENDLLGAIQRLDPTSTEILPEIVRYLYNHVPMAVWGSPERVQQHLQRKRRELEEVR